MKWLKYFVLTLSHPVDTFYIIKKDRKHISKLAILTILLAAVAVKILFVYCSNFTVATTTAQNANAFLEIGVVVVPILLWALASYALMTVCGGESTVMETFTISIYSLAPYIVFMPILTLVSRALANTEMAFYVGARSVIIAWVVILLFIGFMQSNGLKFSHAVGLGLVAVIVMILIAATFLLAFGLGAQIVKFIQELVSEIKFFLL